MRPRAPFQQCAGMIHLSGSLRGEARCQRAGVILEDGKWWCAHPTTGHAPSLVRQREEKARASALAKMKTPDHAALLRDALTALRRIGDRRMWRTGSCGLTWEGETEDGNLIETDDPRDIAAEAIKRATEAGVGEGDR